MWLWIELLMSSCSIWGEMILGPVLPANYYGTLNWTCFGSGLLTPASCWCGLTLLLEKSGDMRDPLKP